MNRHEDPPVGTRTLSRRTFLSRLAGLAAAPALLGAGSDVGVSTIRRPRRYGKTPFAPFPIFSETRVYGAETFQLTNSELLIDALSAGVSLVNTNPDHRNGGAEKDVGRSLKHAAGPVFVMTQIPAYAWAESSRRVAFHRALRFSLDRLRRGNVEALLVRNAEPAQLEDPEFRKFAMDVKSTGTVKHIGFSGQSADLEKSLEIARTDDLIDVVVFSAYMARFQTIPELLVALRDAGKFLVAGFPQEAGLWGELPGWESEDERRRHQPWNGEWDLEFTRRALSNSVTATPAHNAVLSIRRADDVTAVLGK